MDAGREMDALVAEHLMGWRLVKRGRRVATGPDYEGPGEILGFSGNADARRWIAQVCPAYSTEIAAAWSVVELFPETGRGLHLMQSMARGGRWRCTFDMEDGVWGDTAPHAICLAALKSVGYTPEAP
jgi:hypothetical protein